MIIYTDTRQKEGKHDKKHTQIQQLGFEIVHKALSTGDYMLEGNENISIDTKQSLNELYSNIFADRGRFMREIRRAYGSKIKLIVLTEHGGNIKTLNDVALWKPKYGKASGRSLFDNLVNIHMAYGTEFLFCDKRVTGKRIVELLTGNTNEYH